MPTSKQIQALGVFGAIAPVIYVLADVIGGLLWPGYSHYSETVSTLTSTGAPNQEILVPLFAIYNICVILLALGLYYGVEDGKPLWGSTLLAVAGIGGLALFAFPQDYPQGPPVTFTGTMHVVGAGIIAFAALAAMVAFGLQLRHNPRWTSYARFSIIMLPIAIVLGAFGAISITTPYAGLAERLSIGSILFWVEILSIGLITSQSKR